MEGCALLFLDGPKDRLEFSLNGVFGRTLAKFDGFYGLSTEKIHLISYRLGGTNDTNGVEGAFTSLFLCTLSARIYIFEWSKEEELYKLKSAEARPDDFVDRALQYPGMISMERFMDQQPGALMAWNLFTDGITRNVLERVFKDLVIDDGVYQVTPMTISHHSLLETSKALNINEKSCDEVNLSFTVIPSLKDFARINPNLATECAMDRTPILVHLLQPPVSIESLLSELKLSFLLLTFAQNFEGFEQWLAIVELFCKSFRFACGNAAVYVKFMRIIRDHLNLCPDDFFSGLLSENKLFRLCDELFLNGPAELALGFKSFFETKFGWRFSEEGFEEVGEDAPVILE